MLDWFRDPLLRRRVQAGLNKGEARNVLARAVFMHRLVKIRDRVTGKSELQSQWSDVTDCGDLTVEYGIERAKDSLKRKGIPLNEQLIAHLSCWNGNIST